MKYDLQRCEQALAIKGWTQTVLAERTKLSQAVISKFLTGKSIRPDNAKKIVTALGLRMEEIVRGRVA